LNPQTIKHLAQTCGFSLCGIAQAKPLIAEKERFEKALAHNFHDNKTYLERDIEKRFNPTVLLEGCKSVVVCGYNYSTGEKGEEEKGEKEKRAKGRRGEGAKAEDKGCETRDVRYETEYEEFKIARYAQVGDYHVFMKEKLQLLVQKLRERYGDFSYKTTVDTSAISEKAWAVRAGIGYYGKNGILQTALGSFVLLGILLIDKEVDLYDTPNLNSCGNCSRCISACPTGAIADPYYVDCSHCISHINQYKKETDFSRIAQFGWLVGCDICQEVCPNNLHA